MSLLINCSKFIRDFSRYRFWMDSLGT